MNQRKITIRMGGYTDVNDKLMSRPELDKAITEIQDENEQLKESLNNIFESSKRGANGYGEMRKEVLRILKKII